MSIALPELSEIKNRRIRLGIKQKELAKLVGVSQSLIAKMEAGRAIPSYEVVKKIFQTLENYEHKKEKKCFEIMNKKIVMIDSSNSVKKAIDLMRKNSISQMPVKSAGRIIGSISEIGLYSKLAEGMSKEKVESLKVKDVMAEPFPIVREDYPLSSVVFLLKSSEAILLAKQGKIVGIITRVDVL